VRCVVSVSMLTEGWDANTVTHILGVRAFGTQLLCEQVVGRGLRRRSYTTNDEGRFDPEYAEVYGVPFSFIPAAGSSTAPPPRHPVTRVRALPERIRSEIYFPRVVGYRHELSTEHLRVKLGEEAQLALSTHDVPSTTELSDILGALNVHTLEDLRNRREQEIVYFLARRVTQRYFADRPWLFPQLVEIVRDWISECLTLKDNTFTGLLLLHQRADDAADRIFRAIVAADPGEHALLAVLAAYEGIGSTRHVDFDTTKPVMRTDPELCHVSHVVADSGWEHKLAQTLETMPEVRAYVKNKGLGFTIPYTIDGEEHHYMPDFILRVEDGHGEDDLLNLIVEVSGAQRRDKEAKVATVRSLWVPAVNSLGTQGRWGFVECEDPWDAEHLIRGKLAELEPVSA
jgi:type III restriction enzyme